MPAQPTITTIGFDADDTLWHTESIFEATHQRYCALLSRFHDAPTVERALTANKLRNLELFGYGVKSHALSSIETAIELSEGAIRADEIRAIIDLARGMLEHPVELIDGAAEVLTTLAPHYELVLLTKGDPRDQERKLDASGLASHFEHVEVLSEKDGASYQRVFARHAIEPARFAMVGNSLKSDILPVLGLGGRGVYVPYRITWAGERAEPPSAEAAAGRFFQIESLRALPRLVEGWA